MPFPLSIIIYDAGPGGAPTTTNPRNLAGWVESYEDSLADEFGCESLRITGKAPSIEAVIEWAQLLMASVEVDTPTGRPRFRGFLHEVQIPALEVSVSLTDLANAVIVRWSAPDGTKGTQTATNAASIARYGRKEIVLNLSSAKAAEATNRASMVLAQVISPPNKETVTVGEERARPPYEVTLIFRGWCEALKWLTTSNTTDTDAVTSTQVTTLITAYNTVNNFFDTTNTSIVATGFSATQYCDPDTTYHERIAMLLAHGNSATQRVSWGFYTRAITIATSASADPSTITYYYSKRTGELRDADGNAIPPWDWVPNVMVQSIDLIEPSPLSASAVATLTRKCIRRVTLRIDKEGRASGSLEADNPETLPEMLAKPVSVTPGTSTRHAQIESRIIRAARVRTINTDNPNIFDENIGVLLPDGGGAPPGGAVGGSGAAGEVAFFSGPTTLTSDPDFTFGSDYLSVPHLFIFGAAGDITIRERDGAGDWLLYANSGTFRLFNGSDLVTVNTSGQITTAADTIVLGAFTLNLDGSLRVSGASASNGDALIYNGTAFVPTAPGSGTVGGTGTAGRLMQWAVGGANAENSTLIKSGAGILTLSAASTQTITISGSTGGTLALAGNTLTLSSSATLAFGGRSLTLNTNSGTIAFAGPGDTATFPSGGTVAFRDTSSAPSANMVAIWVGANTVGGDADLQFNPSISALEATRVDTNTLNVGGFGLDLAGDLTTGGVLTIGTGGGGQISILLRHERHRKLREPPRPIGLRWVRDRYHADTHTAFKYGRCGQDGYYPLDHDLGRTHEG